MGLFFGGSWLYRVYVYIDIRVGYILIFRALGSFLGSWLCSLYVYMDIRVGYIWTARGGAGGLHAQPLLHENECHILQNFKIRFPEILDSKISKFLCFSEFWFSNFLKIL